MHTSVETDTPTGIQQPAARTQSAGHREQQGNRTRHCHQARAGRRRRRHQLQQRSEAPRRRSETVRALGRRAPPFAPILVPSPRFAPWSIGPLMLSADWTLINNAGIEKHAAFWDVTGGRFQRGARRQPEGRVLRHAGVRPAMSGDRRSGKIINISSVHEELAFPNFAAYIAKQRRCPHADPHTGGRTRATGHHDQQHRARSDRDADQRGTVERPSETAVAVRQIPLGRLGVPKGCGWPGGLPGLSDSDYVTGTTHWSTAGSRCSTKSSSRRTAPASPPNVCARHAGEGCGSASRSPSDARD